ncbi:MULTISPECIES: M16 family metallopeptidase [unclassified Yoonia]|uniref:M16 family metallopeptidase n=1 Tax=unclassified Yoonia TaxID=2629118 RepID=UPI002AFEF909|nr:MULTISPECIES: insulinase family protein [unclassified Yoonia]
MIRHVVLLFALLALTACKDEGPNAATQTSANGVPFTLITLPEHEYVSIQIAWGSDWAYRAETNKAAAIVGTHLILAGGATGYPAGAVAERLADIDSDGVIYDSVNDHIIGELTFTPENMDETIQIANAHLRAPNLDTVWFDRIKDEIAQNIAEAQARPDNAGFDAMRWAVFGDQPLRNALSFDDPETFARLTIDDVAAWHQEIFTQFPTAVVIAGDIDADAAGAALDALLFGLPATQRPLHREATPDFTPRRILLHVPDAEVTTLAFIAPISPTNQGGEIEDMILVQALGGDDDQSVLFNAVRTDLRASYGFGADIANYTRAHRILFMTGQVETEKLAQVESTVRTAYATFLRDGLQGSLDERKKPLETYFAEMPEYVVDQAQSELQSALDDYPPGRSLDLVTELQAVTAESLMARLATAFPAPDALSLIAISPDADALAGACVITSPREAVDCP